MKSDFENTLLSDQNLQNLFESENIWKELYIQNLGKLPEIHNNYRIQYAREKFKSKLYTFLPTHSNPRKRKSETGYPDVKDIGVGNSTYAFTYKDIQGDHIFIMEHSKSVYPHRRSSIFDRSFKSISVGNRHVLCLDHQGNLFGYGGNETGQLGFPPTYAIHKFFPIPEATNVIQISAGFDHSAFINDKGELYIFGRNALGAMGTGFLGVSLNVPTKIKHPEAFLLPSGSKKDILIKYVSCGTYGTVFIDELGDVYITGPNANSGIGSYKFVKIESLKNIVQVSCGETHIGFLDFQNNLYMMGDLDKIQIYAYSRDNDALIMKTRKLETPTLVLTNIAKVVCNSKFTSTIDIHNNLRIYGDIVSIRDHQNVKDVSGERDLFLITQYY